MGLVALNLLKSLAVFPAQAGPIPPTDRTEPQNQILTDTAASLATGRYATLLNARPEGEGLRLSGEGLTPPRWSGDWADFGLFSAEPQGLAEPFNSLRADWTAQVPPGTRLELDLRVSPDKMNWTLWQTLDGSGQTAYFGATNAFLYAQYRVRLFSQQVGQSPTFSAVRLEANRRNLDRVETARLFALSNIAANAEAAPTPAPAGPPTFKVHATREGLVGWRTANGHIIQARDHFVSLPSWTALNDLGKSDYRVRIIAPNGRSAVAPVWDVGPWNFKDNYWHNPRNEFKDLPVGVPQAEKAFYENHNGGLNESGRKVYGPSGIDIGDGTYWDDLDLNGADGGKLDVTFLWEGSLPAAATVSEVTAFGAWHNGVGIKWNTATATSTWVEYGLTPSYGQSSPVDNRMVGTHNVVLTDLTPGQTYHFRVRGKDIYGTDTTGPDATFQTPPGLTLPLDVFQKDKGIGATQGQNSTSLLLIGARQNPTLWNDNPQEDYLAGAATPEGKLANTGNLDLDFTPVCDEKGQNCTMGYGSGYKNFVRFSNAKGETFEVGLIHGAGISPGSVTLMIEGNQTGNKKLRRYNAPDTTDQKVAHHFHFFWWEGRILVMFDHGQPQVFDFNGEGLRIAFVGAGRAKDDIVAANFRNIAFSPNAFK